MLTLLITSSLAQRQAEGVDRGRYVYSNITYHTISIHNCTVQLLIYRGLKEDGVHWIIILYFVDNDIVVWWIRIGRDYEKEYSNYCVCFQNYAWIYFLTSTTIHLNLNIISYVAKHPSDDELIAWGRIVLGLPETASPSRVWLACGICSIPMET